ncbi:DUF1799 domain-containing protein [Oryzifoliimicrobium ureilyticus]|uniref:DUF1799 domain-containing protein n=1 Tax=Oryzifoliimicrobium ureilyticus TaxID=3113724 RepID=UPI0030765DB3
MGLTIPAQPETAETDFLIMPNAWESFKAFISCSTQWRMAVGFGGVIWLGMDYPACKLVLDDLQSPPHVFADLRLMEAAALPVLNEA